VAAVPAFIKSKAEAEVADAGPVGKGLIRNIYIERERYNIKLIELLLFWHFRILPYLGVERLEYNATYSHKVH